MEKPVNILAKTGITLLKTSTIFLISSLVSQELRNSTRQTTETLSQGIRYMRNKNVKA